jgi:hypothetical protein
MIPCFKDNACCQKYRTMKGLRRNEDAMENRKPVLYFFTAEEGRSQSKRRELSET